MPYKNKEDQRAASKRHYELHKQKYIDRARQRKLENPERERQYQRNAYNQVDQSTGKKLGAIRKQEWRLANPELDLAQKKQYRDNKRRTKFNLLLNKFNTTFSAINGEVEKSLSSGFDIILKEQYFNLEIIKSTTYVVFKYTYDNPKVSNDWITQYFRVLRFYLEEYYQENMTNSVRKSNIYFMTEEEFILMKKENNIN